MQTDTKIILTALFIISILLCSNLWILLTTEHYAVARFEVYGWDGYRLQIGKSNDDVIRMNKWYYPIKNDYNLSVGDDILVHYVESILGGRTYVRIEKLHEK